MFAYKVYRTLKDGSSIPVAMGYEYRTFAEADRAARHAVRDCNDPSINTYEVFRQ